MISHRLKNALYFVFSKPTQVKKAQSGGLPSINNNLRWMYYFAFSKPMQFNAWMYRTWRASRSGVVKAHLGPGQQKYLKGWVNVDANFVSAKIDVWADLRNRLPFPDQSVDAFFSNHVIEHLPEAVLPFHFAEMYRCLKPGGLIRVGGPHGDNAARKFLENDPDWFLPSRKKSIGGRYSDFIMCAGEHITILTLSYLKELAESAGFVDVRPCQPLTETFHGEVIDAAVLKTEWENTPEVPHTLTIEAVKPGAERL